MQFTLNQVVLTGDQDSYSIVRTETIPAGSPGCAIRKECALTRAYAQAMKEGVLQPDDLQFMAFVDTKGREIKTVVELKPLVHQALEMLGLNALGASHHMVEVGKWIVTKYDVEDTLAALNTSQFSENIETNKWLKLIQIACQDGRVLGEEEALDLGWEQPVAPYSAMVYIDEKRQEYDGPIYVQPDFWDEVILPAYTTADYPLHPGTTLIKTNCWLPHLAIKGVMVKATHEEWDDLCETIGRSDIAIILGGHAIKFNTLFEVGQAYYLENAQQYFAYHADSGIHRGHRINMSKQLFTRSFMDTVTFFKKAAEQVFERINGLTQYDLDHTLAAIGAFTQPKKTRRKGETVLETAAALNKRILLHGLPPNHPANAQQVRRLTMSVIREQLVRLNVPGFKGMGCPSNNQPGMVGVPRDVYNRWLREHGSPQAYLFRSPYLGDYCGKYVTIYAANTDTIRVNWEDALAMEGDFDGDEYSVVPAEYMPGAVQSSTKPARPPKTEKAELPLTQENIVQAVCELATAKSAVGLWDTKLSTAFDQLYWLAYAPEARVNGAPNIEEIARWQQNIKTLQMCEQMAIEGLKHNAGELLSKEDLDAMFGENSPMHPYTQLIGNKILKTTPLESTRQKPGYLDLIRATVKPIHSYHPLHPIMERLAQMEIGEVCSVMPYHKAIAAQHCRAMSPSAKSSLYKKIREDLYIDYRKKVGEWDGGQDKNRKFGKHVLESIRERWTSIGTTIHTTLINLGQPQHWPLLERDLHLLLASVCYEPQPNWVLRKALDPNCRRGGRYISPDRHIVANQDHLNARVRHIDLHERKGDTEDFRSQTCNKKTISYCYRLPRSGALFHHLVEPKWSREILGEALPHITQQEFYRELVSTLEDLRHEAIA